MKSKETGLKIIELTETLTNEINNWIEKGNKSSAKRARKLTLDFEKLGKQFRKESVSDCTTQEV